MSAVLGLVALLMTIAVPLATPAPPPADPPAQAPPPSNSDGVYIVVTNGTVQAEAVADRYGVTARHTYGSALKGFSATLTADQAGSILSDPAVSYVQRSVVHRITDTQAEPPSWGLDRVDQRALPLDTSYTYPSDAAAVHAYVIDTGVRTTHADFGGRAESGYDAIDGGPADDCHGHGTHVAGTIAGTGHGVAKAAKVVAVRVLGCDGSGTTETVLAGVDWVTANAQKPAVANMSLGGGPDSALDDGVRRAIAGGVTFALSAGNGSGGEPRPACDQSPARGRGGAHRLGHRPPGHPRAVGERRRVRGPLRAGRLDRLGVGCRRRRHAQPERHVDGGPACDRRGRPLPGRPPRGDTARGGRRRGGRRHARSGAGPAGRHPQFPALHRRRGPHLPARAFTGAVSVSFGGTDPEPIA